MHNLLPKRYNNSQLIRVFKSLSKGGSLLSYNNFSNKFGTAKFLSTFSQTKSFNSGTIRPYSASVSTNTSIDALEKLG